MTAWILFKFRFLEDLQYQRKVLSTVVDWVISLYILIPGAIFTVIFYWNIWGNITDYWLESLPPSFVIVLLLLFSLAGSFRTFMQEPDQLFLLDKPFLYQRFRRIASLYSILLLFTMTLLVFVLTSPWLVQLLGLEIHQLLFLFTFTFASGLLQATCKQLIHHALKRRTFLVLYFLSIVWLGTTLPLPILFLIGVGVIQVVFIWQLTTMSRTKKFFHQEVNEENKQRVRYAKMILGMATNVEKMPIRLGKRPLFLRQSKRLFKGITPEDGLLELLLKGFLRHSVYRGGYLRLIAITAYAVILFPLWLKWIMFALFFLFLNYNSWLEGLYRKLLDQPFFSAVPVSKDVQNRVWPRFKRWLVIPALSFIGLLTVFTSIIMI